MTIQTNDYIATRAEVRAYLDKALQDTNEPLSRKLDLYDEHIKGITSFLLSLRCEVARGKTFSL